MQLILFLIGVFLIGCVLYGIYAGVLTIVQGIGRVSGSNQCQGSSEDAAFSRKREFTEPRSREEPASLNLQDPVKSPAPTETKPETSEEVLDKIEQLKSLFELHKNGALSLDEFEWLKQRLLSANNEKRS